MARNRSKNKMYAETSIMNYREEKDGKKKREIGGKSREVQIQIKD